MADHLIRKSWGLLGALATALLTLALIVPTGAEAASPGSAALSQLAALVPAPAQSAVSAALAQIPSASGAGASGGAQPGSPPAAPVVAPPAVPPVPVVARPTPQPAPENPAPAAPAPSTAGAVEQSVSALAGPVPQPDAGQAVGTESTTSRTARSDRTPRGRTRAHRFAHPRAHRPVATSARPAGSTGRAPVAHSAVARPWSPVLVLVATSRRGTQPAVPARRADSRSEPGRRRHLDPRRSRPGVAVTTAPLAVPLSPALPPGGAEGSAAGAGGGGAGAAAAALLAFGGLCILRALLPGLLGLGLAPARSAFLVSRLERPG